MSTELGPRGQNPFLALVTPLLRGKKVCSRFRPKNQEMVRHLKELIASGEFEPVVDRSYPLDQIVEAYRYVETGQKIGNVVVATAPTG